MNQYDNNSARRAVTIRVRQNTMSAAIAALLMLYYAFSRGGYLLPDGDDAFAIGGAVFIHTLKWGGFAMLIAAGASAIGVPLALLFDGVCSILIGVLFGIAAALMMTGGGTWMMQGLFGLMFLFAGVRNVTEWRGLPSLSPRTDRDRDDE